jgi:ABC-type polysaccharide/polyol phosphate export permease
MDGVYRRIADINPLSYLVEGFRSLTIDQLTLTALLQTILIPAAISIIGIGISLRTLRNRLASS